MPSQRSFTTRITSSPNVWQNLGQNPGETTALFSTMSRARGHQDYAVVASSTATITPSSASSSSPPSAMASTALATITRGWMRGT